MDLFYRRHNNNNTIQKGHFSDAEQFSLAKKFPAFYGTQKINTAFPRSHHLSLSSARSIQSMSPSLTWRSILILSSNLRLGLPSGLFPTGFPTKALYAPPFSPIRATYPAHLVFLHLITRTILGEYRSLSSSLCSFLHSLLPSSLLAPKYSTQHPILKLPQPTFLPQCEGPSFTPIQNNRQNCTCVSFFTFLFSKLWGKIICTEWQQDIRYPKA